MNATQRIAVTEIYHSHVYRYFDNASRSSEREFFFVYVLNTPCWCRSRENICIEWTTSSSLLSCLIIILFYALNFSVYHTLRLFPVHPLLRYKKPMTEQEEFQSAFMFA